MQTLTLTINSTNPGCPPISCGKGGAIGVKLVDGSIAKAADPAGWLIGTIADDPYALCSIGASGWVYVIEIPDSEFSTEYLAEILDAIEGADAASVCCIECGPQIVLDRLEALNSSNAHQESFRIHADDQPIEVKSTRLFRRHSVLLIDEIEISCEEHLVDYPYPSTPGEINVGLLSSPSQQTGPATALSALLATIDPASSSPLTGIREFVPPLELPSGSGLWGNTTCDDPEAHLGLEIHVKYRIKQD